AASAAAPATASTGPAPAAPAPATAAAPEAVRPAAASPDWTTQALRQLGAEPQATFARAMALLLNVSNPDELAQLDRLQTGFKRMRWYSAVAMGEKNGRLVLGWAHSERLSTWAHERALGDCNRAASTPCVLALTDGSFRNAALQELAPRLATQSQAAVRDAFMRNVQRMLRAGGL
ncbi:MAG: hypothetical protein HY855_02910, partial [Burkholderiales bacterium]|nr:hypothetical protein [Burkholderiales bacterium]